MKTHILLFLLLSPSLLWAQKHESDSLTQFHFYDQKAPFAHTYSIVATDPETGEMAAAVQSHWFSVGSIVIWGKSGVGVVATQSMVNPAYGPNGLQLMEMGIPADKALEILVEDDEARDIRQVAFLDVKGNLKAFTGKSCIDEASHIEGENYSVQANMMLTDKVPAAMAKAFEENGDLPLAERVLEALKAAEQAGGDIRGKQSAALIVVSGEKGLPEWQDKLIDLRVDDSSTPIAEIERLLKIHRAYEHMNNGDLAIEHGDMPKALEEYNAAQEMFPNNQEMKFWTAVTLANNGDIKQAAKILKAVYKGENGENWRELLKRLPKAGILNVNPDDLL